MQGWNGITVDLDQLSGADGPGLVAFVAALRARLPSGDLLAVDVAACSSVAQDIAEGYRLPSLARVASVVLMAYDEHGPWFGPGPIGGLPWVERTVDVARSQVPASRLVLGIAAYGFRWPPGRQHLGSTSVTVGEAQQVGDDGVVPGGSQQWGNGRSASGIGRSCGGPTADQLSCVSAWPSACTLAA